MSKKPKPPRDPQADTRYAGRDRAAVRGVATFRAMPYQSIAAVYMGDATKAVGHITTRLAQRGLLTVHKRALPGGVTYVTATLAGCRFAGVPEDRGKAVEGATLDLALAVTWYCTMESHRRYRLHRKEDLIPVFGDKHAPTANVVHIASEAEPEAGRKHPCIARVYLCASHVATCVKQLTCHVEQAMANPRIRPWAEDGDYFLLGLTDEPRKLASLRNAVSQSTDLRDVCHVALAPTAASLAKFLKDRRKKK